MSSPAPADTIYRLKSKDDGIFPISSAALRMSPVLSGAISEAIQPPTEPIPVFGVPEGSILEKVIEWLEHHKSEPVFEMPAGGSLLCEVPVPQWDLDLLTHDIVAAVAEAANYLEVPKLMVYCGRVIAMAGEDMNTEQLRVLYGY